MTYLARPGCVLRSALVSFGLLFLPMSIWFGHRDWHRYWGRSLVLLIVSAAFLWVALSRRPESWVSVIDDLDSRGPST
jgi:hypothetical protein